MTPSVRICDPRDPRLREAVPADHAAFSGLFPELAIPDPVPDGAKFERELMRETLMAEEDGRVVGCVVCKIYDEVGYVHMIITARTARRRGVGRAMMGAAITRFRAAGCTTCALSVKPDNHAAIALYESFGLRPERRSVSLTVPWSIVPANAVDARGAAPRAITPEDDATVERACGLMSGQLAMARRNGRTLVVLERGGTVAGATVFDPAFPGAYPFRVASADDTWLLLSSLRPFALPEHASVVVNVEGRPDIVALLRTAGATIRMETMRMSGPIPSPKPEA
jgi:ribosomal protein S18 acetylase RimI-like enzyme